MKKKVLFVDDSATMRQLLAGILRKEGYEAVGAASGREGLKTAKKIQFDAIIVDLNMPEMSGLSVVGALRRMAPYKRTPIFMLTGESEKAKMAAGKRVGVAAWLTKPIKPTILTDSLQQALYKP